MIGRAQKLQHLARDVFPWTFPSLAVAVVTLSPGPANVDLPDVVVAGLPVGGVVAQARPRIKIRVNENTAGGGNALVGNQNIRIMMDGGVWGIDDIVAIPLLDNYWSVPASTAGGGDVVVGSDVSGLLTGNGTYHLRFQDADVDLADLVLRDVQVIIEVLYR